MFECTLFKLLGSLYQCIIVTGRQKLCLLVVEMFNCGGIINYLGENCVESDFDRFYLGTELTEGKLYEFDGNVL